MFKCKHLIFWSSYLLYCPRTSILVAYLILPIIIYVYAVFIFYIFCFYLHLLLFPIHIYYPTARLPLFVPTIFDHAHPHLWNHMAGVRRSLPTYLHTSCSTLGIVDTSILSITTTLNKQIVFLFFSLSKIFHKILLYFTDLHPFAPTVFSCRCNMYVHRPPNPLPIPPSNWW